MMKDNFILTQTKTVTLTPEQKITVVTESLDIVDVLGNCKTMHQSSSTKIEFYEKESDIWRTA